MVLKDTHIPTRIASHTFVLSEAEFFEVMGRMRLSSALVAVRTVIESLARLAAISWAKYFLESSVWMHLQRKP